MPSSSAHPLPTTVSRRSKSRVPANCGGTTGIVFRYCLPPSTRPPQPANSTVMTTAHVIRRNAYLLRRPIPSRAHTDPVIASNLSQLRPALGARRQVHRRQLLAEPAALHEHLALDDLLAPGAAGGVGCAPRWRPRFTRTPITPITSSTGKAKMRARSRTSSGPTRPMAAGSHRRPRESRA